MSNRATFAYLTRLQKEIGFRFLPRNFRSVLKKCLNVYMTSLEAEFVQFKVNVLSQLTYYLTTFYLCNLEHIGDFSRFMIMCLSLQNFYYSGNSSQIFDISWLLLTLLISGFRGEWVRGLEHTGLWQEAHRQPEDDHQGAGYQGTFCLHWPGWRQTEGNLIFTAHSCHNNKHHFPGSCHHASLWWWGTW